jgi:uncharacterized membrane protein YsdA (DUF1294 family)
LPGERASIQADDNRELPMSTNTHSRSSYRSPQLIYGTAALGATIILGLVFYLWLGWNFYLVWLIVCNVVTFVFFRYDKRQAQTPDATRVPEVVLLGLALAGGFLGGWAGMFVRPRHKVHKPLFWVVLIAATLLHLVLIANRLLA